MKYNLQENCFFFTLEIIRRIKTRKQVHSVRNIADYAY